MRWQTRVRELAAERGLEITSGYRSPKHNLEIGGAAGSYHTRGTVKYPGALDVGGDREALIDFCHAVEGEYAGHINELFLKLHHPEHWYAVKNDKHLAHNPEAGHGQHCHVALRDLASGNLSTRPSRGIDDRQEPAMAQEHHHSHHNDPEHRLRRIEESVGRIEESVGLAQAALERIERKMAVNTQVKDAMDALEAKIGGRVTTEVQQVKDAISAAVATAAATIDELNAKIDQLVAEGNPSDTVTAITELGDRLDTEIDSIGPNPAPPPPPPAARGR